MLDGSDPCGGNGASGSSVEELDQILLCFLVISAVGCMMWSVLVGCCGVVAAIAHIVGVCLEECVTCQTQVQKDLMYLALTKNK